MKKLVIMLVGLVMLAACPRISLAEEAVPAAPAAATAAPDLGELQRQIDEMKAKLTEMEALKSQLTALEAQIQATSQAQKQTEAARAKEAKEHKTSGYLQVRYRNDNTTGGKDEFLVRRARLMFSGNISPQTAYRVELQADAKEKGGGPGSKVQLRTAYIDQLIGSGRSRFGQAVLPWGYELEASIADIWTGERAFFMDRLFPDQRDIGLQYRQAFSPTAGPIVDVGVFNGTGINTSDNNNLKDPLARVKLPFRNGSAAVSYYEGRSDLSPVAKDGQRYGVGTEYCWGPWAFLGEYVTGKDRGEDINGWYAQLGTKVGDTPSLLFAKYDTYDENTNLSGDTFKRWSYGYFYDLDPRNRLTLVYEDRKVGRNFSEYTKWDGDTYFLQWRVKW